MCRRFIFSMNFPALLYGLEYPDLLLHISSLSRLSDQLLNLIVDILELFPVLLTVDSLIFLQSLQLLCLPHGPVVAFLSLFCPVPIHIPDHGCHQLILDALEGFCKIILIMSHSSALLPQHPVPRISTSGHY